MIIRSEIILIRIKNTRKTRQKVARIFAESFEEDGLYEYMLPRSKTRREVLIIFFETYLGVWAQYGEMVATTEDLSAVAYIFDEACFKDTLKYRFQSTIARIASLRMLKYISLSEWRAFHKTLDVMSSDWIKNHVEGEFLHLDLIGVIKSERGKGRAKQLINYAKQSAKKRNVPLTLETQNPNNEALYEYFGFDTCEVINYYSLKQYCMIIPKQ
ncbi:MAG: GNAT family N-acetyltransferase [Cellulosilyticaceae bacterium]